MKTSVERIDETKIKLTVTVEAERVDAAIDEAAVRVARDVKVPGFRPGKVPRRVLESRLGKGALVSEAVRDALPAFYAEAAQAEDLQVVGPPEFDVDTFEAGADATFSATVEVRPEIEVPDYADLQIPHPEWEVTEEEVEAQIASMRERFAELETVNRPISAGDYAVVTVTGERDGKKVDEVSVTDLLYRVPETAGTDENDSQLDRNLLGAEAGAILKFTDTLGPDYGEALDGAEVSLTAIVKEVKDRKLPELDDDFAITASEYDTYEELRDGLREQMATAKRQQAVSELRGAVVEAVTGLVEVPLPEGLVNDEVRFRLNRLGSQAEQYGMSFEQYLEAAGTSAEDLLEQVTDEARRSVKAQLVVDAIGRASDIEITQEDLGVEVARQAARFGRPPEELAEFMTHPDRIGALVSDAFRRKTIDHLVASVQVLSAPPEEAASQDAAGQPPGEASDQAE